MYSIAVREDFSANHYLIGGDWGAENSMHTHHYQIEVLLEGNSLDEHGYLADIFVLKTAMNGVISRFRNILLNDLEEFHGNNPSIERFACIVHDLLFSRININHVSATQVKIWEDANAWTSYRKEY